MENLVVLPRRSDPLSVVSAARNETDRADRAMADALLSIQESGAWRSLGYENFRAYLRAEAGIGARKAATLIRQAWQRRQAPAPSLKIA